MGKKQKIKQVQVKSTEQVIYEREFDRVRYQGMVLTGDSIRAFFGLAILGKMVRFGVNENKNVVVVERVPEDIESYFGEIRRILEKYKGNPAQGFHQVELTTRFAEKLGIQPAVSKEKNNGDS